jgi:hypothetical protein
MAHLLPCNVEVALIMAIPSAAFAFGLWLRGMVCRLRGHR